MVWKSTNTALSRYKINGIRWYSRAYYTFSERSGERDEESERVLNVIGSGKELIECCCRWCEGTRLPRATSAHPTVVPWWGFAMSARAPRRWYAATTTIAIRRDGAHRV